MSGVATGTAWVIRIDALWLAVAPLDMRAGLENRIRPIALGRANWLFCRSLLVGKRVAAVMSLIQSTGTTPRPI
jgi:transposase